MADRTPSLSDLPGDDLSQDLDRESKEKPLVTPDFGLEGVEDAKAPNPSEADDIAPEASAPEDVVDLSGGKGMGAGLNAMREVQQAKRAHAEARDKLARLQAEIDSDNRTLEHRLQIANNYESILSEMHDVIDQAQRNLQELDRAIDGSNQRIEELSKELADLKAAHERDLKPYKELAEASDKRANNDASAYRNARKAAQSAEKRVKDLTKQRDRNISQARKDADNASEQIDRLQSRLAKLNADPVANAEEIAKLTQEIQTQSGQQERANARAQALPTSTRADIDAAQNLLNQARATLDQTKKANDVSKRDAQAKQDEYKKLKTQFRQEENALDDEIVEIQKQLRALQHQANDETNDIQTAQAAIQEAEDIHSNPEITEHLANKVADNSAAADVQRQQVDALAQNEVMVRKRTKQARIRAIAIIILLAIVAMAIIGFVLFVMGDGG